MRTAKEKFGGFGEDILGAGFHILSGASGDVKLLVQQAVARVVGDAYVSRAEYDDMLLRLAALEKAAKKPAKPIASKSSPKKRK